MGSVQATCVYILGFSCWQYCALGLLTLPYYFATNSGPDPIVLETSYSGLRKENTSFWQWNIFILDFLTGSAISFTRKILFWLRLDFSKLPKQNFNIKIFFGWQQLPLEMVKYLLPILYDGIRAGICLLLSMVKFVW